TRPPSLRERPMLSKSSSALLAALLTLAATTAARAQEDRSWAAVYTKHDELEGKREEILPDHAKLNTEEGREAVKAKVVPLAKEMVANLEQIKNNHAGGIYNWHHIELRSMLYVLGDEETIKKVDEWIKASGDGEDVL